jgi:hypothetical protein
MKIFEVLPAVLAGVARSAPTLARGAGATKTAAGKTPGTAVAAPVPLDPAQQAKQDNRLKSTLAKLNSTFGVAGGPAMDLNRTAQTLTKPPTGKPDPAAARNLEPMLPALSKALQNPQSADLLAQAIKTGVSADLTQTAKDQAAQAKKAAQSVKP